MLHIKDISQMLRKQVSLCRDVEENQLFPRQDRNDKRAVSPSMSTESITRCDGEVRREMMGSFDNRDI